MFRIVIAFSICNLLFLSSTWGQSDKKRIAVLPINDATVLSDWSEKILLDYRISEKITELLDKRGLFDIVPSTQIIETILINRIDETKINLKDTLLAMGTTLYADVCIYGKINSLKIVPITRQHPYIGNVTDTQAEINLEISLFDVRSQMTIISFTINKKRYKIGKDFILDFPTASFTDWNSISKSILNDLLTDAAISGCNKTINYLTSGQIKRAPAMPPAGRPTRLTEELLKGIQD